MPDQAALTMPPPVSGIGEPVGKAGPAHSATSDMPRETPPAPPVSEEVNTPKSQENDANVSRETTTGEDEGQGGDAAPDQGGDAETGGEGEAAASGAKPGKKGISERFSEVTAARRAA